MHGGRVWWSKLLTSLGGGQLLAPNDLRSLVPPDLDHWHPPLRGLDRTRISCHNQGVTRVRRGQNNHGGIKLDDTYQHEISLRWHDCEGWAVNIGIKSCGIYLTFPHLPNCTKVEADNKLVVLTEPFWYGDPCCKKSITESQSLWIEIEWHFLWFRITR